MTLIDLDKLPTWDLALRIGGATVRVLRPTWAKLPVLEAALQAASSKGHEADLEKKLREGLGVLLETQGRAALREVDYLGLVAAVHALDAYFGRWFGASIAQAVRDAAGGPGAKASPRKGGAGGLEKLRPFLRGKPPAPAKAKATALSADDADDRR